MEKDINENRNSKKIKGNTHEDRKDFKPKTETLYKSIKWSMQRG